LLITVLIKVFKKAVDSESRIGRKTEYGKTGRLVSVFSYTLIIIIIIVVVVVVVVVLGISFMQGIYTYIPETNHVPREHCVATILM